MFTLCKHNYLIHNFSAMSRHSSILHMLSFIRNINKDRQKKKRPREQQARSNHAMQKEEKTSQKRQSNDHVGRVQSSVFTQFADFLSPRVRSHAPLLVLVLIFSPGRLVEVLATASGALRAAVRVAARLATTDANVRHLDGRGGTVDWRKVLRRLRWVVGG